MSENSIIGLAFRVNEFDYFNCPKSVSVPCGQLVTQGVIWFIPTQKNGVSTGYQQRRSATRPTPDSVKTVRVWDKVSGSTYWLMINDNQDVQAINDICADCCGAVDTLPLNITAPTILIEEEGCLEIAAPDDGVYNYFSVAPAAAAGYVYRATGSKNGTAFTPATPTAGFSTLEALKTWANTNWAAFGTFTRDGQKLTVTSTDGLTGSLNVSFNAAPVANAGPDQSLGTGVTTTTLVGTASTAGTGATISTYVWVKTSGPGTPVITTPAAATSGVTGLAVGTTVFTLTVTNSNGITSTDTVSVVVAP